ncbi:MAG TPA: hypothetical protein VG942_14650 [Hyphomonadaceae bacterium]|nr:hypothetical protein [Hyphomonadaceae bacterium]
MKLVALIVLAVAAPAYADPPRIDWSKPVIGVDSGIASKPKDEMKEVTVFTLQDLNALGVKPPTPDQQQDVKIYREPDHLIASAPEPARDSKPKSDSSSKIQPPSCEPPATKEPAKPVPAPCPAPPR